jgi:exopolysaccharide biosynthesis protein
VLRVDLTNPGVRLATVIAPDPDGDGPADTSLTSPFRLAANRPVVAFVNTNPWDAVPDASGQRNRRWYAGQPVRISGLAVTDGRVRRTATPSCVSVTVDGRGRVAIGAVTPDAEVREGVAGFQQILRAGTPLTRPGGKPEPRTMFGTDADGKVLWIVVADGRQNGFSEGMTFDEMARFAVELGCHDAANMDGGGSSVLGLVGTEGRLRVVNRPSDRFLGFSRIRPLPMILAVEEVAARPAGN